MPTTNPEVFLIGRFVSSSHTKQIKELQKDVGTAVVYSLVAVVGIHHQIFGLESFSIRRIQARMRRG